MLVNLTFSDKKRTRQERRNRRIDKMYPEFKTRGKLKFFRKITDGVYEQMVGGAVWPNHVIQNLTNQRCDGDEVAGFLCETAEEAIAMYDCLINGKEIPNWVSENFRAKVLFESEWRDKDKERDMNLYLNTKESNSYSTLKYSEKRNYRYMSHWVGDHVIIFNRLDDFRWHKWSPYIGSRNPSHEWFSDEPWAKETIIYYARIYKVF